MSRKSSTAASPAPTAAPASRAANKQPAMPIVSSAHLVSPESAEMSEFEFGLIVAGNMWLIQRWHHHNCKHHAPEVARLMDIARRDPGH